MGTDREADSNLNWPQMRDYNREPKTDLEEIASNVTGAIIVCGVLGGIVRFVELIFNFVMGLWHG